MRARRSGDEAHLGPFEDHLATAITFVADVDTTGKDEAFCEQARALQVGVHVPVEVERFGWEIEHTIEPGEAASADSVLIAGEVARGMPFLVEEYSRVRLLTGGDHLHRRI